MKSPLDGGTALPDSRWSCVHCCMVPLEAGLRTDHHAGTTWSPIGQTPVVVTTGERKSISMVPAISPREEFCFRVQEGSMNADRLIDFLKALLFSVEGRVFLRIRSADCCRGWYLSRSPHRTPTGCRARQRAAVDIVLTESGAEVGQRSSKARISPSTLSRINFFPATSMPVSSPSRRSSSAITVCYITDCLFLPPTRSRGG